MSAVVSGAANPARGEASFTVFGHPVTLRPTFHALVKVEEEIGSLFEMVERAAGGKLRLVEIATLFWHCLADQPAMTRDELSEAIVKQGLSAVTPVLTQLVGQILKGL